MKIHNIIFIITGIIIFGVVGVLGDTIVDENLIINGNVTTTGTIHNYSTSDTSIKLYADEHNVFGNDNGESIELWGLKPYSKPYIGWYAWDEPSNQTMPVGWMGCHYGLTNDDEHSHCSIETLDNSQGTPTINSHFEISYSSEQERASVKFPRSDVQFLSDQKLYFGDVKQGWIQHNSTIGGLQISASNIRITNGDLSLENNNIKNVKYISSSDYKDLLLLPSYALKIFPGGQLYQGLVLTNTSRGILLTILGGSEFRINSNDLLILEPSNYQSTCDSDIEGAIYYNKNTHKHYGCNGTEWNSLY